MFNAKNSPLLDVYAILWHIVRAFPAVTDGAGRYVKHKRPETFAALMNIDDIDLASLGKSGKYSNPDAHLFYSRKWSETGERRQQTGSLQYDYPVVAVETQSTSVYLKEKYVGLRVSVLAIDQLPGKGDPRTLEQFESDLSIMFDQTIRELVGTWAVYLLPDGTTAWIPGEPTVPVTRLIRTMRDCIVGDTVEGRFYHDAGSDKAAFVQGFVSLKLPRIDCYLTVGGGKPVSFDYGLGTGLTNRRPDGVPGNPNEQETPTS